MRMVETSPVKNDNFHLIYLPNLHLDVSDSIGLHLALQIRPHRNALYSVSVRQTEILPPTSFRFNLTVDTLVLS